MTEPRNAQTDDHGKTINGSGSITEIKLVGFDKPFMTAVAVVLSLAAAMFCFFTQYEEERRVYFTQRCEAYVEQAAFNHQPVNSALCGPREK